MIFVTGGAEQGKTAFVSTKFSLPEEAMISGDALAEKLCGGKTDAVSSGDIKVLTHYELFVKKLLDGGRDPEQETEKLLISSPDIVILNNDIGGGIVPADPEERAYREICGRLCCRIAARADEVYTVTCGIGSRIK